MLKYNLTKPKVLYRPLFKILFPFVVSCRGVVQLGGPVPCYNRGGPAKMGARKSFLFTGNFLVV